MTKREIAEQNFYAGYNCAQALVVAFADELGMDRDTAAKLSSSFGGGMGRMREVCGAVSGMLLVAGMLTGYSEPNDPEKKAEHYRRVQALAAAFRQKHGSIVCRDLLASLPAASDTSPVPEARTEAYYHRRPCAVNVGDAAEILESFLASGGDPAIAALSLDK